MESNIEKVLQNVLNYAALDGDPEKLSRVEKQLLRLLGDLTVEVPEPQSRVEVLLQRLYEQGFGSGSSGGGSVDYPAYTGSYVVIPSPEKETTLATRNRTLSNDVVVRKIPYYETTPVGSGTTVYIGMEVITNG